MNIYQPTRLYIKKHIKTNLRYFGKTCSQDIDKYLGSGKRWNNHIKRHGKEFVITEWVSDWFYNADDITEFALAFSELFNIVTDKNWANLMIEDGLSGGTVGPESLRKISKAVSARRNDPSWQATIGKTAAEKLSNKQNDPRWIESVGRPGRLRQSDSLRVTLNDPSWQQEIGVAKAAKQSATLSKTKNDADWKNSVGKEFAKNLSNTATGRKRLVLPNGKFTWVYPDGKGNFVPFRDLPKN